jgi:hypothetical protein
MTEPRHDGRHGQARLRYAPSRSRWLDQGWRWTASARWRAAAAHSARLTIDITPELRGRIKIAAFGRGTTVADMLRDLLAREFPDTAGDRP